MGAEKNKKKNIEITGHKGESVRERERQRESSHFLDCVSLFQLGLTGSWTGCGPLQPVIHKLSRSF